MTHLIAVEITCQDSQTSRMAEDRLRRWLFEYGHTASDFGFEFNSVSKLGKRQKRVDKLKKQLAGV